MGYLNFTKNNIQAVEKLILGVKNIALEVIYKLFAFII